MPCPICGTEVAQDHRRRYCSVRCRRAAEEARRRQKAAGPFAEVEVGEIASRSQVLELLTVAARSGHVAAMRVLLEELREDPDAADESFIDELARRRTAR